ncbi:hypothetical protein MTO96_023800 [Rhipicephalus appendiculatus]
MLTRRPVKMKPTLPANPPASRGATSQAPSGKQQGSTAQHRLVDDWSPLYELDNTSSHSPASTGSQDRAREPSISSLSNEGPSKPTIPGTTQSHVASREMQGTAYVQDAHTTASNREKELSPVPAERPPASPPNSSARDDHAKPGNTVSSSSEAKPTQYPPASTSDFAIPILKKPAASSPSSSESPRSDSTTKSALPSDDLRQSSKSLERVSRLKETSVDTARAPWTRSRTTSSSSKLPYKATAHQNAKGKKSASASFPKAPVRPPPTADSQSWEAGRSKLDALANKMEARPGETRSKISSLSSAGTREEVKSDSLDAPVAIGKPSRGLFKWRTLFSEPSEQPVYYQTLTESDKGSPVKEKPQSASGKVIPSGSGPVTGNSPTAVDQETEPKLGDATQKKVLLVSASHDTSVDVALAAPGGPYSGSNVRGLEHNESPSSPKEVKAAPPVASKIQFRPPSPHSDTRKELSRPKGGEEPGATTPGKTSMASHLVSSISNSFRDIMVMATTRRFFMVTIFCIATTMPAFQWLQYSIVSNIVEKYYDVGSTAVSWTAMVFYAAYVTMAIPCAWVLEKYGLRITVLCGACLTAIGACIKLFSVRPDRFTYVIIGQVFPALTTAFTAAVPARLASAWFKYEEISKASSVGMLGVQLGSALGFVVPPHVLHKADVQGSLRSLCIGVAIASSLAFLVVIVFFEDKPVHPPSFSEMLNRYNINKRTTFGEDMRTLMKDRNFILLLVSYGINTGCFYSISTTLNPVILNYFPGDESFAGILGLCIILSGFLGSWMGGYLVDKTEMFKGITLATYVLTTVTLLLHSLLLLERSHALTLIACTLLGFFLTGYMPLGVQLGAEITYPLNEALPACLLSMAAQGTSLVITHIFDIVRHQVGTVAANLVLVGMLVIGCFLTVMLHAELKRQEAYKREQRKLSEHHPHVHGGARDSIIEEPNAANEPKENMGLFGTTGLCSACNKTIPAFEMVMRARGNVYHLECFACQQCNHRFCVGDRFYLHENRILCEYDYEERMIFANMPYFGGAGGAGAGGMPGPGAGGPMGLNHHHGPPPPGMTSAAGGGLGGQPKRLPGQTPPVPVPPMAGAGGQGAPPGPAGAAPPGSLPNGTTGHHMTDGADHLSGGVHGVGHPSAHTSGPYGNQPPGTESMLEAK